MASHWRWGQDKMTITLQQFQCHFLFENSSFCFKFHWNLSRRIQQTTCTRSFQITAWSQAGFKPLSEWMTVGLLMYIFVTRPRRVHRAWPSVPADSPHKGPVIWKALLCHNVITYFCRGSSKITPTPASLSAEGKDHHGISSGWSSVWHRSNTGLSSTQYEQIPIILGVWPFWLTPFFFSVNNILAGLWLNCISSVEITLFLLADKLLQHRALFQCKGLVKSF